MTKHPSFRKKRSYTLPVVIIGLALLASFVVPVRLSLLRGAATAALYPFQFAAAVFWRGAVTLPVNIVNIRNLGRANSELKARLAEVEPKLARFDELSSENDRLREALGFRGGNRYRLALLPAQVIGRAAGTWNSIIVIGRGAAARVRVNRPVVVKDGLVGKVIEVSAFSAKVLLLTDPQSSVAATDQRSRAGGVAEGYSPNKLRMKYVGVTSDVATGDAVVTSTASGLFPAGIPVGTVAKAEKKESDLFYEIELKPAADLSRLETVFVVE
ncbi:MAG: rod shape-determining protein MreC [Candidatus Saganbacteria bacterium]|nr:rod shape-determining protein MreC [Candidatus Saganbacteria bacterium]